ncbi:phospholipase D-like domain-containing protein [Natrialba hulunbeirensis]|nr:phospholipase D-like domain-containing protein [Natrialba hulunbeirensis]
MSDLLHAANKLRTQSPERLWGLSTESIYSALAAKASDESIQARLEPHIRAEIIRTNDERDSDLVVSIHEWLLGELSLIETGDISLLGLVILSSDEPQSLIRAVAVARLESAEMVLRSCIEIDGEIPRRELDSLLADEWDETVLAPLLGSLGFLTIYPDSAEFDQERIDASLSAQQTTSTETAVAKAHREVISQAIETADGACLEALVQRLTGSVPSKSELTAAEVATLATTRTIVVNGTDLEDAIRDQRQEYEDELDKVQSLLVPSTELDVERVEMDQPVGFGELPEDSDQSDDEREAALKVVATVAAHPDIARFDVHFVTERWPSVTSYSLYQILSSVPGVECEVSDGLVEFETVPEAVDVEIARDEYMTHLVERCSAIQNRIDTLSQERVSFPPVPVATESMVVRDYESIESGAIAPTYFTYTLVDPDALGEKKMDAYVGDSRGLGRERARLRRWHEKRSSGLESYTAMTDRLFSLGLERDIEDKVLRIMTPFDDDTFNEYVAQIRRLLEHGFELRLLTRHTKEPWEWRRLQRNLLSEIKEHRDQVTVRTYSRFKEHQRVTSEMDFRDLGEIGIHGKLQTVGAPEEGAVLLGSANFMENSYDWNPECGVYTERTQFVDAAIEFFDIVWHVSAADELSINRLQEIPDRKLVPTYYS